MTRLIAMIVSVLAAGLFAALLSIDPASSQAVFPTVGGSNVDGKMTFCLDGSNGTAVPCGSYNYKNINSQATTVVKSGAGVLHTLCINTVANTGTATIYDNTSATGTKIGTVTQVTGVPSCLRYDVGFATGLTIVTAVATPDITISYR